VKLASEDSSAGGGTEGQNRFYKQRWRAQAERRTPKLNINATRRYTTMVRFKNWKQKRLSARNHNTAGNERSHPQRKGGFLQRQIDEAKATRQDY